jgi:hypothetical protein
LQIVRKSNPRAAGQAVAEILRRTANAPET